MRTRRNFLAWLGCGAIASLPWTRRLLPSEPDPLPPKPTPIARSGYQPPLTLNMDRVGGSSSSIDELSWELVDSRGASESLRRYLPVGLRTGDGTLIAEGLGIAYEPTVSLWRHRRTGEERVEYGEQPQGRLHIQKLIGAPRAMRKLVRSLCTPTVIIEDLDHRITLTGVKFLTCMAADFQTVGVVEEVEFAFETMSEEEGSGDRVEPMV